MSFVALPRPDGQGPCEAVVKRTQVIFVSVSGRVDCARYRTSTALRESPARLGKLDIRMEIVTEAPGFLGSNSFWWEEERMVVERSGRRVGWPRCLEPYSSRKCCF